MSSTSLKIAFGVSFSFNLVLVMLALITREYGKMNQAAWDKQSVQVLEWAERLSKEYRPFSEVKRLFPVAENHVFWSKNIGDMWTIAFEVDTRANIQSVSCDGISIPEFIARMKSQRAEEEPR